MDNNLFAVSNELEELYTAPSVPAPRRRAPPAQTSSTLFLPFGVKNRERLRPYVIYEDIIDLFRSVAMDGITIGGTSTIRCHVSRISGGQRSDLESNAEYESLPFRSDYFGIERIGSFSRT